MAGISLNNPPHSIALYQPNSLSLRRTDPIQDALLGASRKGRLFMHGSLPAEPRTATGSWSSPDFPW